MNPIIEYRGSLSVCGQGRAKEMILEYILTVRCIYTRSETSYTTYFVHIQNGKTKKKSHTDKKLQNTIHFFR